MTSATSPSKNEHVVFFIDEEEFTSETEMLTPRTIIVEFAKEDPALTTLVLVHGKDRTKLEALDKAFEVKNGTKFTILHHGPTTVS